MAINQGNADIQVGSAATIIVNSPSNAALTFIQATATNVDSASHNLTLYRVSSGGSAGTANIIGADAMVISGGVTAALPIVGQSLIQGQMLEGKADAGSVVNVNVSWLVTS